LYFFYEQRAVITDGFVMQQSKVPVEEIDKAKRCWDLDTAAPEAHTWSED
jgi:hypothetical protein